MIGMEYQEKLLREVLPEFRSRFRHMDEIYRLTKELAEGISRDDRVSTRMLLDMRGKELESMNECTRHIQLYQNSMQSEICERLGALLNGEIKEDGFSYTESWKELREIAERTKALWQRTVELDRAISRRLAGDDSYYQ